MFNQGVSLSSIDGDADLSQAMIAPDNGKPVARQGRKAVSLKWLALVYQSKPCEIVWLPKAIRRVETKSICKPPIRQTDGFISATA